MDKIFDFFKEFKERLRSPLFSSLIISWLISNWRIIIGLFAYKRTELREYGYSYFNLVTEQGWFRLYLLPFIGAGIYCFIYPYARNFIGAFQSKLQMKAKKQTLKIMGEASISAIELERKAEELDETKLKLQDFYLAQRNKFIEDLKNHQERLENSQKELQIALGQKSESDGKLATWRERSRSSILNGNWELNAGEIDFPSVIYISQSSIYNSITDKEEFRIMDMAVNIIEHKITFYAHNPDRKGYHFSFDIAITPLQSLVGFADGVHQVVFKRVRSN